MKKITKKVKFQDKIYEVVRETPFLGRGRVKIFNENEELIHMDKSNTWILGSYMDNDEWLKARLDEIINPIMLKKAPIINGSSDLDQI